MARDTPLGPHYRQQHETGHRCQDVRREVCQVWCQQVRQDVHQMSSQFGWLFRERQQIYTTTGISTTTAGSRTK